MIAFSCPTPGCDGRQQLSDEVAGQTVICPSCFQLVKVPGNPPAAAKKADSQAVPLKAAPKPASKPAVPPVRATTPRPIPSPLPADVGVRPIPAPAPAPTASGGHRPLPLPPAPTPETRRWFYDLGGSPCGPVAEADVAALAKDERIFPHTLVWNEQQVGWLPAGGVLPRLFKGATADDLRPPTPAWQRWVAIGLVCVAMTAVAAAALTFLLTGKKKTPPTTAGTVAVDRCVKTETISQVTPGQPDPGVRT